MGRHAEERGSGAMDARSYEGRDEGSRESERCLLIAAVVALLLGLVWLLGRAA